MGLLTTLRTRVKQTLASREGRAASTQFTARPRADFALLVNTTSPPRIPRWRQLRYAGLVFSGAEQRILAAAGIIFILALGMTVFSFASSRIATAPASGGKVVEAVVGSPKGINPLFASANDPDADLTALVFAGLFRRVNGKLENELAESAEWSGDGKILTITLKPNVAFQDGTALTSDDVLFTLESAKNPAWRSPYAGDFRDATFSVPDERTIVITLGQPDATFQDALTIGILPAHIWADVLPQNAPLADANVRPVGAGPFAVNTLRKGTNGSILSYELVRFNGYAGTKPYLDRVELRFYPDRIAAEDAVRNGQADMVAFVPGEDAKKFPQSNFQISSLTLPEESIAFLNVNDPLLKDGRIREALALSIDRDDIVNVQNGFARPVAGPFPADVPGATSSTEERLASARKLLDAAGWKLVDGSDVRLRVSGNATTTKNATSSTEPFTLTITVPEVPNLVAIADALARRWSLLNIRVTVISNQAGTVLKEVTHDRKAQVVIWNVLLPPTEDLYPIWWSGEADGSGLNLSNLKDRDVDAAIKDVGAASSTEALAAAKKKLSNAILARTPAVFLTQPTYGYVVSKRVNGVSPSFALGTPSDRFTDIANWYVKTSWGLK